MGSPSDLSLDCKPSSYSLLLKSFGDQVDQTYKLEEFLTRLEEERLKIDAFKRELPLCMQLLNNAMEASRQQLENYQTNHSLRPVLEEFIPLKRPSPEGSDKLKISDKATWMDSAQLWSQANNPAMTATNETDQTFSVSPKLALDNKQRSGGAFLPFSKERNTCTSRILPELALASGEKEIAEKKYTEQDNGVSNSKSKGRESCNQGNQGGGVAVADQGKCGVSVSNTTEGQGSGQTHRKARRCWSPDLHRRFVNALQQLGGSQVATPKQIRELMKVDGLTNDEVKSHLQKYRLHTRRPSPIPQTASAPAPQLVVLGGIWVPPEYATAAAAAAHTGPAIYGAATMATGTAGPTPYCPPPVHQDFYTQMNSQPMVPQHQLHHHHHHHHMYKTSPQMQSSPQSDGGGAGRSESIEEDCKSESDSWKGDSAEKEGGRGLLSLRRVEGEEEGDSTGSEITLKF